MTGTTGTESPPGRLEEGLNWIEERTHPFYSALKRFSTLAPVWEYIGDDLGRMIGWERLIDRIPQWVRFMDLPVVARMEERATLPATALLQGGVASLGGMTIISGGEARNATLQNRLTEIFRSNPAALAMQAATLRMLLLSLHHGEGHHHHESADVEHQAQHLRDTQALNLITDALQRAYPHLTPTEADLTAFSFRPEMGQNERRAFVVREKILRQIGREEALLGQRQDALDHACLSDAPPAGVRPARPALQLIKWDLVMAGFLMLSPCIGPAVRTFHPAAHRHDSAPQQEILGNGAGQYYEHPLLRDVGLYAGCVTLTTFAALQQRKRTLTRGEKVLKVTAFGGHMLTELSHSIGVLRGLADQFPHVRTLLEAVGQTAARMPLVGGEFIAENISDVTLAEGSAGLAQRITAKLPLPDGAARNGCALFLANILALAGTNALDQTLALMAPCLSGAVATVFGGYGAIKAGQAVVRHCRKAGMGMVRRFGACAASVMAASMIVVLGGAWQTVEMPSVMPGTAPPARTVRQVLPNTAVPATERTVAIRQGSWLLETLRENGFSAVEATRISESLRSGGVDVDRVYPDEPILLRIPPAGGSAAAQEIVFRNLTVRLEGRGQENATHATAAILTQQLAETRHFRE